MAYASCFFLAAEHSRHAGSIGGLRHRWPPPGAATLQHRQGLSRCSSPMRLYHCTRAARLPGGRLGHACGAAEPVDQGVAGSHGALRHLFHLAGGELGRRIPPLLRAAFGGRRPEPHSLAGPVQGAAGQREHEALARLVRPTVLECLCALDSVCDATEAMLVLALPPAAAWCAACSSEQRGAGASVAVSRRSSAEASSPATAEQITAQRRCWRHVHQPSNPSALQATGVLGRLRPALCACLCRALQPAQGGGRRACCSSAG